MLRRVFCKTAPVNICFLIGMFSFFALCNYWYIFLSITCIYYHSLSLTFLVFHLNQLPNKNFRVLHPLAYSSPNTRQVHTTQSLSEWSMQSAKMTNSIKSFDHLFFTVSPATLSPGFIFKCSMQNSSQWGVLHGKKRS